MKARERLYRHAGPGFVGRFEVDAGTFYYDLPDAPKNYPYIAIMRVVKYDAADGVGIGRVKSFKLSHRAVVTNHMVAWAVRVMLELGIFRVVTNSRHFDLVPDEFKTLVTRGSDAGCMEINIDALSTSRWLIDNYTLRIAHGKGSNQTAEM